MGWKDWFAGSKPPPVAAPALQLPPCETKALPETLWPELQAKLAQPGAATECLPDLYAFLTLLNRRRVTTERQSEVLQALESWLAPAVDGVYQQHIQSPNNPEWMDERREQLRLTVRIVDELALLAQRLLLVHWAHLGRPTPNLRRTLALYALRAMELLRVVQRLYALRYQKLSATHWLAANQIFFGLHSLELTTSKLPALPCLNRAVRKEEQRATLEQVYISLQFFGLLDATTWPLSDVGIPDAYLRILEPPLSLRVDDGGEWVVRQAALYADLNTPAHFQRLPVAKQGLVLEFASLFALLEKHQQMLQRQLLVGEMAQATPTPLQDLALSGRLTVVDRMLYRLQPHRRIYERQPRQNVFLRLGQTGFARCPAYLRQMTERRPVVLPAGDPPPLDAWRLLDESLSGIRVTVREYPGMPALEIGLCVLFERLSGCIETVGYIQRLHRLEEHALELAVVKLGQQPQPVELQDPTRLDEQRWPGLLALSPQGEWMLALPPSLGLQAGAPLWLWREDGGKQPSRLGERHLHSQDLALHTLRVQPLAGAALPAS